MDPRSQEDRDMDSWIRIFVYDRHLRHLARLREENNVAQDDMGDCGDGTHNLPAPIGPPDVNQNEDTEADNAREEYRQVMHRMTGQQRVTILLEHLRHLHN